MIWPKKISYTLSQRIRDIRVWVRRLGDNLTAVKLKFTIKDINLRVTNVKLTAEINLKK